MVKTLLVLVKSLRRSWLLELAGATLIIVAVFMAWGVTAGLIAAGVALILKAAELDLNKAPEADR